MTSYRENGMANYIGQTNTPADISVQVEKSTHQTITTATLTDLTWDTEIFDTDSMHDNSTNNERLTCNTAGKYLIIFNAGWQSNATGYRYLSIELNDTTIIAQTRGAANVNYGEQSLSCIRNLAVDDYVKALCYHTRGSDLQLKDDNPFNAQFSMVKIA